MVEEAANEADTVAPGIAVLGATHQRAWTVREAARAAIKRRTISGRATELFARHGSFVSLGSRLAFFSVLHASDKFSRASYVSAAVPRNSLRSEQRAFARILLLICVSW